MQASRACRPAPSLPFCSPAAQERGRLASAEAGVSSPGSRQRTHPRPIRDRPPPLFITAGAGGREGVMPAPQLANAGFQGMSPCPLSSLLLAGSSREGAPGFPSDGGEFTRRALPTGQPLPERLQRLATSRILTHQPDAYAPLPHSTPSWPAS